MRIKPAFLNASKAKELSYWLLFPLLISLSVSISGVEIFSSGVIILAIAAFLQNKDHHFLRERWVVLLGVYIAAYGLSWAVSDFQRESFRGAFRVLRHVLLCLSVAYVIDDEKKMRRFLVFFLIVGALIGADALVQAATNFEWMRQRKMMPYFLDSAYRVTGPYHHPNDFSAYLSLVLFLFWGMAKNAWRHLLLWQRVLAGAGLASLAISLWCTYSRGAWIAVAAVFLLWGILRRSKAVFLTLIFVIFWGFFLAPQTIQTRLSSLAQWRDGTMTERRLLWGEAISMMRDRPWLGYGPNTYSKVEPLYKSKDFITDHQYAHNGYLQIGAETGLIGLFAFLIAVGYGWLAAYRTLQKVRPGLSREVGMSLLFGVLAFLIHASTDTDLQSLLLVNLFWMSMGVIWSAKKISPA